MSAIFNVGDRVVVARHQGDHIVGHYGHVWELLEQWVLVDIEGRISGPVHHFASNCPTGWAFLPCELEHAD